MKQTLLDLSKQHPFEAYNSWWEMGKEWSCFMSEAIVPEWLKLSSNDNLDSVKADLDDYISPFKVYRRHEKSGRV